MVAVGPIGRNSPPFAVASLHHHQPLTASDRQPQYINTTTATQTPFLRPKRHTVPNKQYNRLVDSFAPTLSSEELVSKGSNTSISYGISSSSTCATDSIDDLSENNVGSALIESGIHHYSRGENEKAMKAFSVALKTQRISLEECDHVSIAHTLGNIGAVYLKQHKLNEAFDILREALDMKMRLIIAEQSLPGTIETNVQPKIQVADTLNNMGTIAFMRGNFEDSMRYYRRALRELREQPPTHPNLNNLADCLQNIGRVHVQQREWTAALNVLQESEKLIRELHGDRHILLISSLKLIGFIHLSESRLDEAMEAFLEVQVIVVRENGHNHVDTAASWFNIGMVREAQGKLKDSWEAYNQARVIYFQNGLREQADHAIVRNVRRSMALVERMIIKAKRSREKPINDDDKTIDTASQFC